MDILSFILTLAKVKKIPGTAVSDAIAAANDAEAAADRAALYGQRIELVDNKLVIGEDDE